MIQPFKSSNLRVVKATGAGEKKECLKSIPGELSKKDFIFSFFIITQSISFKLIDVITGGNKNVKNKKNHHSV